MLVNRLKLCGFLSIALMAGTVQADKLNDLQLSYGEPVSKTNLPIKSFDARYTYGLPFTEAWPCQFGPAIRANYLEIGTGNGWQFGVEAMGRCNLFSRVQIGFGAGGGWLTKYYYRDSADKHHKDFGGPWQFLAGINIGFAVTEDWTIGYEFSHMSDWNNYDKNPTINSNNLFIRYAY